MTSKLDQPMERGTSPLLPALREGQSSLVAASQGGTNTPTPRQKASQWAQEIRLRINHCLENNGNIAEEDVVDLKRELISLFIVALQQDSRAAWVYLHEVLGLVEPYKEYLDQLDTKSEFFHYVERIFHHVDLHKERLFDLQITDSIAKVFPKEVALLRQIGAHPARNYCSVQPVQLLRLGSVSSLTSFHMVPKKTAQSPRQLMLLPDGSNPYSTHIPHEDDKLLMTKPLTIGDLRKSIADVAFEMATRESIWTQNYGNMTMALQTDIPEEVDQTSPKEPSPPTRRSNGSTPRSSVSSLSGGKKQSKTPRSIQEEQVPVMTGREAVEYFAKLHHIGKIKSIYFNMVPHRHYRPYDLISTQKNKANPEHYVFSTFGVLHVYADQPAESMSLSDWQREAVLWTAVSSIPFFKNFLIQKMFYKWRYNKLYLDYSRKREAMGANLLQAVPSFGAALLQIYRLLKELITVKFLPFDTDKCYQLSEFENLVNYKNMQGEKILEKFFRYCKMVVDVTAEESFKKLRYCEEQVRKKTVFTKDSLHMQRLKKETREENLRRARSETSRLGNFVKLVDQMIVEHLFDISKTQVISFVQDVLYIGSEAPREGFFTANLIFTKQDMLGLAPVKDKFLKVLSSTLKGIPSVLCANAVPMDGSITDHDTTGDDTESSAGQKSEMTKSLDNLRKERRKSTAATTVSSLKQESHTYLSEVDKTTAASVAGETTAGETTAGDVADTDQDSQIGEVTKSVAGDEEIPYPDLPKQIPASKEDDEMGVATPALVIHDSAGSLKVTGEGFMGQYNPLTRANLEEKLEMDKEFQKILLTQKEIIETALDEIDQYCDTNSWLNEIHIFCKRWNDKSVKDLKGEAAFRIERKLNDMRQWSEKVRNFDKNFTTENGLFFVDCSAIHEWLLPRLSEIYEEVVTFVADEAKSLADSFCDEIKVAVENMKDKRKGVDEFAVFAKNFSLYKKNSQQYQQRVEYIKSLYEVIRMSSRQLTPEEEKIEENAWAMWELFLLQMQDASEFVNTETPVMTQLLEDTYQKLEKEALDLAEMASSKDFLDPSQNATRVLAEMRKIRENFYNVQLKLHQASKSREAICGEPYDLTFLNEITVKMDVRQELWKYVESSNHAIREWKQMLFKKMNIKKALEKVSEWQAAAGKLKQSLPQGDLVLSTWFTSLQEFKKDLPVLHKLANDALKERHWKAIFVGMNESFDPDKFYTVADLLAYDLDGHSHLIHTIYLGAIAEYDLEINIAQVKKFWEERQFKLAKHIPDSIYNSKDPPKKPSSPRRRTKLEKFRQERAAAKAGQHHGMNVADDDFFVLIEVDELKYQLEDSRISIKAMMQSPYLGDMRQEVEFWDSALQQVEEITDLWFLCQKKWLYLLKIFERADLFRKYFRLSHDFEEVHSKFKDWMRVVSLDSKVMTVVHRKRGEKGYRLLQGDNLRALLLNLIQKQEEILKFLDELLENSRNEFPRLYFLSNDEMVELLGISRNPKALLPFAKKCFPGIASLSFDLPPGTSSINSLLDFALNVDKLQVTTVYGIMGEEIPLYVRLKSFPQATKWLKTLETIMKNTMAVVLEACVQARMEEGSKQPIHLLEELAKFAQAKAARKELTPRQQQLTSEIKETFRHWLLRFPVQSVLVSEGILWERCVNRAIEKGDVDDLKLLSVSLTTKLDQYVELLKENRNFNGTLSQDTKSRLNALLCNLMNQTTHHRDIVEKMISSGVCNESSFEWLRVLRYHMDIQTVLRAKTEQLDTSLQHPQPPPRKAGSRPKRPLHAKFKVEATIEEPPKLFRTKTTVSNDYQFSLCYLQQLGTVFNYDYEYHGPVKRLVLTPLTERAFLSLTQAVKNFHCGTLIGPPGTGKSETIKELAKMFGRLTFTINCNEDITVNMMNQFMVGMVQSGCFGIFDDTDRLTKGLMSVTAQNIDYLRTALRLLEGSSENQYLIRGQPRIDKIYLTENWTWRQSYSS
ncbi:hypothetical protein KUTeg_008419 [Tegillarca granosa]|uniref:Dynein heavy chain n=1 Tax=Tegillarca granosa TaxID=220873 RepID=A0ABQ9FDW5_TEGGR|nr:hypothetical protein KUTeg_008419 [Tegillarca granosa]